MTKRTADDDNFKLCHMPKIKSRRKRRDLLLLFLLLPKNNGKVSRIKAIKTCMRFTFKYIKKSSHERVTEASVEYLAKAKFMTAIIFVLTAVYFYIHTTPNVCAHKL